MQESLLSQGFTLLTYGMGTVFVFLIVLIIVTTAVSEIIVRFFPEAEPVVPQPKKAMASTTDPKTLKIIQAAIDQHRSRSK